MISARFNNVMRMASRPPMVVLCLMMNELIADLDLGALAPGVAVTPRQRGPPPSRTSGRGEVAELAGGASRPYLVVPILLTISSYMNILDTLWEPLSLLLM